MEHVNMDHSHMDHGNMGHDGDMDMGNMCKMNMLFNWDVENVCIVFPSWQVKGWGTFLISLLGVVALTAGYEFVREMSRRYEASSAEYLNALSTDDDARPRSLGWLGRQSNQAMQKTKMIKAAFYAAQVFYSFFIMLLFMTYNGYIMLAVAAGAFVGYLAFGQSSATKTVACH